MGGETSVVWVPVRVDTVTLQRIPAGFSPRRRENTVPGRPPGSGPEPLRLL
jgi:hypothetical protein